MILILIESQLKLMENILGMFPVYSRLPFSYRLLLRKVNKHLYKYVVDTEREKEAAIILSRAFKRRQLYRLLQISIP